MIYAFKRNLSKTIWIYRVGEALFYFYWGGAVNKKRKEDIKMNIYKGNYDSSELLMERCEITI